MKSTLASLAAILTGTSLFGLPVSASAQFTSRYNGPSAEQRRRMQEAARNVQLGNTLLQQGNFAGAESAYRATIQLDKTQGDAYIGLGDALAARGAYSEAIQAYRELIDPRPGKKWTSSRAQDADVLMKFAPLLLQAGQRDAAIGAYDRGVSRMSESFRPFMTLPATFDPQEFEALAHSGIGLYHAGRGNSDAAVARFNRALQTKRNFALAYLGLGNVFRYSRRQPAQARAMYRLALRFGGGQVAEEAREALDRD